MLYWMYELYPLGKFIEKDSIIMENIKKILMGPAKCAVDLGDGSERGEYVNQDYILHKLGRPHRAINLMYCYYPLDKEWPGRISEVMKDAQVSFQWDYPYDDYFPYGQKGQPFEQMKDIPRVSLSISCVISENMVRTLSSLLQSILTFPMNILSKLRKN